MRVNIYTAYFGGPYHWGRDLALALTQNGISVCHVHTFLHRIAGLFYQDADIIHTTIPFPIKLWNKPLVLTVQGDYTREHNILQRYYPKVLAQADYVTTSSNYIKECIGMTHGEVIPNAVFPERFRLTEHQERRKLHFATIMNFYFEGKVKGLIDLIGMIKRSGMTNFRHIVIGDGPYKGEAEKYADESGLDILFAGRLDDVNLVLGNSDLFLYNTYQDSFPNVVAEAMASGLPVLTNKFGSLGDIITDGVDGYVAGSQEIYIQRLVELCGNLSLRKSMGEAARDAVEQKFNWHGIVHKFIDIYKGLLN